MLNLIKTKKTDSLITGDGLITFLNPYSYLLMRKNMSVLNSFDHIYIDGQWLCNFLSWFNIAKVNRVSFDNSSIAPLIFNISVETNAKVALIGSDESSSVAFKSYLESKYEGINIVYSRNGFFNSELDAFNSLNEVIANKPDIVIVGMGAVKQEEYLLRLRNLGWSGAGFTCGGFMHQTAKKGHAYYPEWINKLNLRFLYRVWDEPKLLKRYTLDYSLFLVRFIQDYYLYKKK